MSKKTTKRPKDRKITISYLDDFLQSFSDGFRSGMTKEHIMRLVFWVANRADEKWYDSCKKNPSTTNIQKWRDGLDNPGSDSQVLSALEKCKDGTLRSFLMQLYIKCIEPGNDDQLYQSRPGCTYQPRHECVDAEQVQDLVKDLVQQINVVRHHQADLEVLKDEIIKRIDGLEEHVHGLQVRVLGNEFHHDQLVNELRRVLPTAGIFEVRTEDDHV